MLQNRVDPLGHIITTKARGSWMGNRGILHNEQQEVIELFKSKAWITCKLEFNNRKREIMSPNRYTELFFLDEATSFAAGHRPCFECRRHDFQRFKTLWLKGNPEFNFDENVSVKEIDDILHKERIHADQSKVTYEEKIGQIPNGTFVLFNEKPYLVFGKKMYLWSPVGYDKGIDFPKTDTLTVLTPKSVVNTFRAGFLPQINFS